MNNHTVWKKSLTFISLTLLTLFFVVPISRIEAATPVEGFNEGLSVANPTNDPSQSLDLGWVYTASSSYLLTRIEGKFNAANGVAITVEFYDGLPSLGGNLLASGSFTQTAAAPAGTVWEGADLNTPVSVVSGNTYFVGFKNVFSPPTTDAAGTAPVLYYSHLLAADNTYGTAGDATQTNINKPIVRFLTGDAPTITSAAPVGGTDGVAYSHTYTATGTTPITYTATPGSLPPGLTLTTAGVLSGTPTTPGTYTGTVTATNGINPDATQNFSITIAGVAPTITSAAPVGGTDGVAYSHTYTATGSATITYTATPGSLPPGLTLTTGGLLSGTPTTPGTYTGTVTASNGINPDATQNFSITIAGVAPAITSSAPTGGTQGTAYSHTYTATGSATITYSATPGSLPPGLTLTTGGLLSGTPTTPGTYTGTVTATNGINPDATQNFSITIAGVAPTITSAAPVGGTDGVAYSHTYTATGSATITYSATPGSLPPGLTLTTGGLLSGTPTTPGTYTGTVTASNGINPDATQNFSITIAGVAPNITSAAPADGAQSVAYTHSYTATGSATITYSATPGSLPPGLTLTTGGLLSGTPTIPGTYTGTVTASNGINPDATQNFSITITAAGVAPTITSAPPPDGTEGAGYTFTYTATGTVTITYSATPGSLPPGLTLTTGGLLSGTPTTPGTYTGTVTATNGFAPDATQNFSITITAASVVTVAPSSLPDGVVGTAYAQTITASGGTAPYGFAVTVGTLPTGLTLSSAGALSGTPTAAGTFNFTVTATDTGSLSGSQAYTVVITAVGAPTPTPVPVEVVQLPEPPPAPTCTDTNFEETGMIRTNFTNDADRAGLSCRLVAANGSYMTWLGGPLTNSGMIGDQTVLDLGVVAAVDVFSASAANGFMGDVNICLKGSGYMIYMNANSSPRVPQLWSAWTTDAFPGYTCTTLYAPGTVIMVTNKP
ncbi:MAG: Ig domain-containing protein [Chloroflexi bacterium]|nr:Ig domain-containing protein [Chloroflexota bacterium]